MSQSYFFIIISFNKYGLFFNSTFLFQIDIVIKVDVLFVYKIKFDLIRFMKIKKERKKINIVGFILLKEVGNDRQQIDDTAFSLLQLIM